MNPSSRKYFIIKFGGILLVLYVLVGGLFLPLKTGITGIHTPKIGSHKKQNISFDVYNPGKDLKPIQFVLKKGKQIFQSTDLQHDGNGLFNGYLNASLGDSQSSALFDLFAMVELDDSKKIWMYFPDAVWIEKSESDTGFSNAISQKSFEEVLVQQTGNGKDMRDSQSGFPNRPILNESIRNLLYHVPMWFAMMFLMFMSVIFAIRYLNKQQLNDDLWSESFIKIGILTGILGCVTGSAWASITWQSWWPVDDPKLNGVAIGMFMYFAYLILRNTLKDPFQRARISSVYAVMIFPIFMALIAIMPKLSEDSLHPGSGGTVGFNKYDLDNTLRMFFYPAVIGWILIFTWITILRYRYSKIKNLIEERDENE